MSARRVLLALACVLASSATGCKPTPDEIALTTRGAVGVATSATLPSELRVQVGDLVAVEAKPVEDDGDPMRLCVEVTSTAQNVADVRSAVGPCDEPRVFVISALAPGTARIRFGARGTWREVAIVVYE